MTGLVLKLGPKERVLINGAVIENGDRRSRITILSAQANILRLKDAIHPDQANTPVRRACYLAQLILSGDLEAHVPWSRLSDQIDVLKQVFIDVESTALLQKAETAIKDQNAYACLKLLKQIMPLETQLLKVRHL